MDENSSSHHRSAEGIIIALLVIVIFGAGFVLFKNLGAPPRLPEQAPRGASSGTIPDAPTSQDLGSNLYEQSTNPLQDRIPTTLTPVPNPIQTVYKNPFQ